MFRSVNRLPTVILTSPLSLKFENFDEVNDTLDKLSEQMTSLDQTVRGLGGRVSETEDRVSTLEDGHNRHTQLVSFLLHRDRQLEARCEALENAQRRDNLRIYGIKEGSEEGDTVQWIEDFLRKLLKLPAEFEFRTCTLVPTTKAH